MAEYERVYKCDICNHIQRHFQRGVCAQCGSEKLLRRVGRWVDTSSFWAGLTWNFTGYWEVKND